MQINFEAAAGRGGQSVSGALAMQDVEALNKALTAGYGTDVSQLTGGGALRIQSLEKTMLTTIQDNEHFRLFNKFAKTGATATVDEWTEQSGVGGFLGGSTNTETGTIAAAQGVYARRVGLVKYLMTRREVSFVQTLQNAITESEAVEQQNGALQLLTDAEYLSFEGDSTVVPTEFDGIYAQLVQGINAGQVDPDNIIDAKATSVSGIEQINKAVTTISRYGNFGKPTDIFLSQMAQSDFDTGLDPAYRVALNGVGDGGLKLGAPVNGIRTSWGNIANNPDVFIREDLMKQPFEINFATLAAANAGFAPQSVTVDATATDASSSFGAPQAGNYYYAVAGVNASGQSTIVKSTQTAVAAGKKAVLTITRSAGALETGYVIYRSRLNGGNVTAGSVAGQGSDFREMCRIGVAGATTTYTDYNTDIPGTTKAFILNMSPLAITWRQLLPMLKFALYPTVSATIPWAQLMFGYLRIGKRKQHAVIKNILPNGNVWKPY